MTIDTTVEAGIMTIRIAREDKRNAITAAMYQQIADALGRAETDPAVRVVVLRGGESVFTAGNDVEDFLRNPPSGEQSSVFQFMRALSQGSKPVIAAVAGPAVGIGTTLLLHCDLVYAADNARFALPFAQLGLCPEFASSLLLSRMTGHQRAAELLMLGEAFDAATAASLGLVCKVLPVAELFAHARAQAAKLAALPPSSLRQTKRLMKSHLDAEVMRKMAEEGEQFRAMLVAPEAREAFSAFLEKRKPDFSRFS